MTTAVPAELGFQNSDRELCDTIKPAGSVPAPLYPFGPLIGLAKSVPGARTAPPRIGRAPEPGPMAPVRRATPEDAAVIDTMLRAMAQESPIYRVMPIDDRKLADYIAKAIRSSDHAVLLHESAAGIDGVYIGMLVQQFFTFETTAMDVLFYVRPERRGSRAAVRLFRAFKAWAKASGAKSIQVGTMTGIDPARTAKFYRGMGLSEIGGIYHGRAE